MAYHQRQEKESHYLFKLKLTSNVRKRLLSVTESKWTHPSNRGLLQVSEETVVLPGWSQPRRVIFGCRSLGVSPKEKLGRFWDETRHKFETYITSLAAEEGSAWHIVELYRKRTTAENVFDELKKKWSFTDFALASPVQVG